ncbi:aliphatic sulfonate ABC transporter substrate-binding protein [Xanthobacter autotrophicus DSM 431]|uniref:aliphatic sulfonate ABC transporter substrate-binding protein n=1 Tax=Xanthobacter nonsaccharivorans TaxID=3119912 RepID=UPI00372CDE9F
MTDRPPASLSPVENAGIRIAGAPAGAVGLVSFGGGRRGVSEPSGRASAMVFCDPLSLALRRDLDRVSPSEATVLVVGETGTGKELVARYIHAASARRDGPFVAVNCGALADTLAEAELFGWERGAFTGADRTQAGWFESANGGTLFLDEIGDLPLPLQVKLLRVLQEREVVRLGSRRAVTVDIRVVAATNVDLDAAIEARRFREDLYFRLNVAQVHLPPLRERLGDVEPLAQHFLAVYRTRLGRPDLAFSNPALRALRRHDWPGNIRELENVVHNAVLLARGPVVESGDLRLTRSPRVKESEPADLEGKVRSLIGRAVLDAEPSIFDRVTRAMVRAAYDFADGNQVRAAEGLGLSRNAFRTQLAHVGAILPRRQRTQATTSGEERSAFRELRIGFQKYGTSSILKVVGRVADDLAALGFKVQWDEYPAGPQLLDALARGRVDFGSTGEAPPVFAQSTGAPVRYVGYESPAPLSEALMVRPDSPLETVRQLKGRTIGLVLHSNCHYFVLRALEATGLGLSDIRLVATPPGEGLDRLTRGEIDAWAIWDPLLTAAELRGRARQLVDGRGIVPNHQFYLGNDAFVRANPEVIGLLLGELGNVGKYTATHVPQVARRMAPEIGISSASLEVAYGRLTYGARPLDHDVVRQQQEIADAFFHAGILPAAVEVGRAVWMG